MLNYKRNNKQCSRPSSEKHWAVGSAFGSALGTPAVGIHSAELAEVTRKTANREKNKSQAHTFSQEKKRAVIQDFFMRPLFALFIFLACLSILPGGGLPVDCWILLNIYLSINVVIFVNEKSLILQSWLKKSVPTLCKFMLYNTIFITAVYFLIRKSEFS